MSHFSKPTLTTSTRKKKSIPEGLWTKCPISDEIVFTKDLEANLMVVPKSGYHFPIGSRERITGPKIGYSTSDFLTTKATRFSGWMIVGSTNASSALM